MIPGTRHQLFFQVIFSLRNMSTSSKLMEAVLQLVVILIFQSLGGPTNSAIEKYLNDRKVPQLFVAAPNKKFGDPKNFPCPCSTSR